MERVNFIIFPTIFIVSRGARLDRMYFLHNYAHLSLFLSVSRSYPPPCPLRTKNRKLLIKFRKRRKTIDPCLVNYFLLFFSIRTHSRDYLFRFSSTQTQNSICLFVRVATKRQGFEKHFLLRSFAGKIDASYLGVMQAICSFEMSRFRLKYVVNKMICVSVDWEKWILENRRESLCWGALAEAVVCFDRIFISLTSLIRPEVKVSSEYTKK